MDKIDTKDPLKRIVRGMMSGDTAWRTEKQRGYVNARLPRSRK
jgi:hypothetical protein